MPGDAAGPDACRARTSSFVADLREGWVAFRSRRWVWTVVGYFAIGNLLWGAWSALGPVVADRELGGAAAWGTVLAAMGVGALAGSLLATQVNPRRPLVFVALTDGLFALPLAFLAATPPVALLACGALLSGAGMMLGLSVWESTLQRHIPGESLSRISSYDWFGSLAFSPLGLVIWAPVGAAIGISVALWLAFGLSVATTLALLAVPDVRHLPATVATVLERQLIKSPGRGRGMVAATRVPPSDGLSIRSSAVEGGEPVRQPHEAAAAGSGAADAVVADLGPRACRSRSAPHLGVSGARVLGDVGQRLGDDEVGGRLDRGGSRSTRHVDLDRHGRPRRQLGDDRVQPALGQDRGRMPWASSRSPTFARSAWSSASLHQRGDGLLSRSSAWHASLSVMIVWTRPCWAPSCRSRTTRRRSSSVAATSRARDAATSVRASAFAIAVATSSVNSAICDSVSGGNGVASWTRRR